MFYKRTILKVLSKRLNNSPFIANWFQYLQLSKFYLMLFFAVSITVIGCSIKETPISLDNLKIGFKNPPDSSKPGVYWFVMDGWITKENVTKDFEAMKAAGISMINMMVVNVGIPKGPVEFFGEEWLEMFRHIVAESKRLGIVITMPVGPGWSGSGGPWIAPDQSMQLLVDTSIYVKGGNVKELILPVPKVVEPYFGGRKFNELNDRQRKEYFNNISILAFPTPTEKNSIKNVKEKALYKIFGGRHYPIFPMDIKASFGEKKVQNSNALIPKNKIIDLSDKLRLDGSLVWDVPPGDWTIMRFVSRNNGANNVPAPTLGMGFESNKMDSAATWWHLESYIGRLLQSLGESKNPDSGKGGIKTLHYDSWEVGTQNWTPGFREEFRRRRGYDPLPYYPAYSGLVVGSEEESERFLWDMRLTSNELVLENFDDQVRDYAHKHGMTYSIEPYVTPISDLDHGAKADYPMGEFWSENFQLGQDLTYSNFEAVSIGHIEGRTVVQAEAFTADWNEAWKQYPWSMKNQGDWAFATGINRFYYHVFVHKALSDSLLPGMTMGPWGVHWDRKQTWWPMVGAYHKYIARSQYLLQQGRSVADILYLVPEDIPQYFLPPRSALAGDSIMPDRRGYNFDACSPSQLMKAIVKGNKIVFPSGASYRILVLPATRTMTPELVEKITFLVKSGATVVGTPPEKSPSLKGYPECDKKVISTAKELWGGLEAPVQVIDRKYEKGEIIWGGNISKIKEEDSYPDYQLLSDILQSRNVQKDFESTGPVRYTHRTADNLNIYFVSNRTDNKISTICTFRIKGGTPKLWDPIDGSVRDLPEYKANKEGLITVPLNFDNYQSYFVVFSEEKYESEHVGQNFPEIRTVSSINGPWEVRFEKLGEKEGRITLDSLVSWTTIDDESIKYYSGIAEYDKDFVLSVPIDTSSPEKRVYLYLGDVDNLASVNLNGRELGSVWCKPWKIDITGVLKSGNNKLKIKVANLWINRLIGDARVGANKEKQDQTDLLMGKKVPGQVSFSTYNPYKGDTPLYQSGLIGPVTIVSENFKNN